MINQRTIRALDSLLNEGEEYRNYEGLPVTFRANPGLDLTHTDSFSELMIPSDYKDLLGKHNGFTLFEYEDIGGFNFFGVEQLEIETNQQKETYEEEWDDRVIVIGNVVADGDFIGLRILENGGYEVLDCYHDEAPQNWNTITDSLDDFILRLIPKEKDIGYNKKRLITTYKNNAQTCLKSKHPARLLSGLSCGQSSSPAQFLYGTLAPMHKKI